MLMSVAYFRIVRGGVVSHEWNAVSGGGWLTDRVDKWQGKWSANGLSTLMPKPFRSEQQGEIRLRTIADSLTH